MPIDPKTRMEILYPERGVIAPKVKPKSPKQPQTLSERQVPMAPEGNNKTDTENKPSPMPAKSLSEDDKKIIDEQKAALKKAEKENMNNKPKIDKREFEA